MIEENILDYKIKKRPIREIDIQYLLSLLLIA